MNGSTTRRCLMALAGALALATPAAAQLAPPYPRLLADSIDAPRLATLEARTAQAEALAAQARARPNPTISGYIENIGGTSPYGGLGRAETTIQYNHPIELGGKRASRIAAGIAGVDAARARAYAGRVAYAHDLARAYAAVEVADRRIALAEDEVSEATADVKVASAMVAAGKEARVREMRAESEVAALTADLAVARAQRQTALAALSVLTGREVPYTGLAGSLLERLPAQPPIGPVDPQPPGVALALAEQKAAAARVVAERRRALPDVQAQIGIRRLEADNATALVAGVQLPLNLFDRNRGNIAAAEAERTAADIELRAQELEARTMATALAGQVAAADRRAAAAQHAVDIAVETYRLTRVAYEAGKVPLSEVLIARHDMGQARGVALDAAATRLDTRAALAQLHGQTLTGEPVQ